MLAASSMLLRLPLLLWHSCAAGPSALLQQDLVSKQRLEASSTPLEQDADDIQRSAVISSGAKVTLPGSASQQHGKSLMRKDAGADGAHHQRKRPHNSQMHIGIQEDPPRQGDQLLETSNKVSTTVSCGGSDAANCTMCPYELVNGTHQWRGQDWCNGECKWCSSTNAQGSCMTLADLCITGITSGQANPISNAESVPDLLTPQFTHTDQEIATTAAAAAMREESLENGHAQRMAKKEANEEKSFSWSKFWLVLVITFSVIVGCCVIWTIAAFFCICFGRWPFGGAAAKELEEEEDADGGEKAGDTDGGEKEEDGEGES